MELGGCHQWQCRYTGLGNDRVMRPQTGNATSAPPTTSPYFRANNTQAGFIDNTSYNLSLGLRASGTIHRHAQYRHRLSIPAIPRRMQRLSGHSSSFSNADGIRNTAIGTSAPFNTSNDTAIGYEALNQTAAAAAKTMRPSGPNAGRQNVIGHQHSDRRFNYIFPAPPVTM